MSVRSGIKEQQTTGGDERFMIAKKALVDVVAEADCRLNIPMKMEVDFKDMSITPIGRWELRVTCQSVSI